jgi:gamma-glutamylcyclotransferase (GGCT)/AIG2-like uncharacterized protein YtfP
MIVAVYGTLKRGCANHSLLSKSDFKGVDYIKSLTIYHGGYFPLGKIENGGTDVEIYDVDQATLNKLDYLEGCPALFTREIIQTRYGETFVYIYTGDVDTNRKIRTWICK